MLLRQIHVIAVLIVVSCSPPSIPSDKQKDVAPLNDWQYEVDRDEMRGSRSWHASITSLNEPELVFPYQGGTPATISVAHYEGDDPYRYQPLLRIKNGQLDCSEFCHLSVRFDLGKVLTITGSKQDCGPDDCVNLNIDDDTDLAARGKPYLGFTKRLKTARRTIVEVPIYRFGSFQYQFHTASFVWPRHQLETTDTGKAKT